MRSGHVRRRCPSTPTPRCPTRCGHSYEFRFSHQGKIHTGSAATERAAHAALRKAQALAERGELTSKREQRAAEEQARQAADARPTVATYAAGWLDGRTSLRPRTRDSYRAILALHIVPALGTTPVAEVTARDVRRMLEGMAAPGPTGAVRSKGTLSRCRSLVSGVLGAAVADGLREANPARGLRLPESASAGRAGQVRAATPGETAKLLALAEGSEFAEILAFIAATGVRRSEAFGLRWASVDLDSGEATISEGLHQRGGEVFVTPPKSKAGRRAVPLDSDTLTWLRSYRREQAAEELRWPHGEWNAEGFVFTRSDGSAIRPDSLSHYAKRLWATLGAPELGVHSLRHGYATNALACGVPVKVVSDVLGHSDVSLTANVYQHTPAETARAAAELIAALRRQAASSN